MGTDACVACHHLRSRPYAYVTPTGALPLLYAPVSARRRPPRVQWHWHATPRTDTAHARRHHEQRDAQYTRQRHVPRARAWMDPCSAARHATPGTTPVNTHFIQICSSCVLPKVMLCGGTHVAQFPACQTHGLHNAMSPQLNHSDDLDSLDLNTPAPVLFTMTTLDDLLLLTNLNTRLQLLHKDESEEEKEA